MTISAYIEQKFSAFGHLTEADMADICTAAGVDPDAEYTPDVEASVGKALCFAIEEKILAPYVTNVSESGFSMSWNRDNLAKYYWWLCRKYGVTPDEEVLSLLGVNMIRDVSDIW